MRKGYLVVILLALLGIALAAILTDRGLAVFTDQAPVTANTFTSGAFPTPTTNSFGALADTYVKEDKGGDDNFGTDTDMHVKSDATKVKRAFVAFDVSSIPAGSEVTAATLTLCLTQVQSGRLEEARRVLDSWGETTITWNNQATVSTSVTDTMTVPATTGCVNWAVAADVQKWVAGVANNGWRISDQDETTTSGEVKYRTRENGTAAERPKLEVTYGSCSDVTAPGAPSGLVGTASEEITLDWNDNGESDFAGYNVYRSTTAGGPYTKLNGSLLLTSSAYTDTGVTGGITYYYVVTAVDGCANESGNSSEDSARVHSKLNLQANDTEMSTATSPTGNIDTNDGTTDYFTASSLVTWASNEEDWMVVLVLRDKPNVAAPATINVWWQNGGACSSGTVPGQIFATGSVTVPIATDGLGVTLTVPKAGGTVDHTLVSGDRLCLSISADGSGADNDLHYYANVASTSGSSGVSLVSGPFSIDGTLDPPTSVSASPILETGLSDLSWTATVEALADGYTILRSTSSGGPYTQIAQVTPRSTTAYQDSNLDCATTYYYVVRSYFETTESVNSNEASSTDNCIGFGATADTYVKEDKGGDDNFGTANEIQVLSESGKLKRSLVAFDVSSIPSGSTIDSATLTLCLSANPPSGAQGRTHELRLVTSSWVETTVVWNDQPTVSGTATDTITVPSTEQCLTFSVGADVQSWVDGTGNYGWRLSDQTEGASNGDVKYRSRENGTSAEQPKLRVTYTPP